MTIKYHNERQGSGDPENILLIRNGKLMRWI